MSYVLSLLYCKSLIIIIIKTLSAHTPEVYGNYFLCACLCVCVFVCLSAIYHIFGDIVNFYVATMIVISFCCIDG